MVLVEIFLCRLLVYYIVYPILYIVAGDGETEKEDVGNERERERAREKKKDNHLRLRKQSRISTLVCFAV